MLPKLYDVGDMLTVLMLGVCLGLVIALFIIITTASRAR